MTLRQFSVAVGAPTRWVQNALAALGLPSEYTRDGARRLAFARALKTSFGVPLVIGYPLGEGALAGSPERGTWIHEDPDGVVALSVDLERFLSNFHVRLSLALTRHGEARRGRPRRPRPRGVAGAREYGVDIGLLRHSLKRTVEERLIRLDKDVEFLQSITVSEK